MKMAPFLAAFVNEKYGWNVTDQDILSSSEQGDHFSIVWDRGIKGGPHTIIYKAELNAFIDKLEEKQEDQAVAVAVFTQLPGVTEEIQDQFYDRGIYTYDDLLEVLKDPTAPLLDVKGLGPVKLTRIMDYLEAGVK